MKRKLLSRKLQHTMTALSASAAVFTMLLLAGSPSLPAPEPATASILVMSADRLTADNTDAIGKDEQSSAIDNATDAPATVRRHRSLNRTRALLALPYFSFAQGLRHTRS